MKLDAKKVVEARERLGLAQEELATRAEVSPNTILRVEHGLDIRPITARRIARGLGLEVDDLYPKAEAPTSLPPDKGGQERRYLNSLLLDSHTLLLSKRAEDTGGRIANLSRELPPHTAFAVYQWVAQFIHECESYENTLDEVGVMEYAHSVLERDAAGEHVSVELLDKVRDFHEAHDQLFYGIELEALDWVRDQFSRPEVVELSNKERREYEKRSARTYAPDNVFLWEDFSRLRQAKEGEKKKQATFPGSRLEGAG
jgi:transcriptional regulator with XRE-family HTH domain